MAQHATVRRMQIWPSGSIHHTHRTSAAQPAALTLVHGTDVGPSTAAAPRLLTLPSWTCARKAAVCYKPFFVWIMRQAAHRPPFAREHALVTQPRPWAGLGQVVHAATPAPPEPLKVKYCWPCYAPEVSRSVTRGARCCASAPNSLILVERASHASAAGAV